jgi:nucleotide-binding universal stress UspA family protein
MRTVQRILVPVDGSAIASRALDFAIERAKVYDAAIAVVFVENHIPLDATDTPHDAEADAMLQNAQACAARAGVRCDRAKLAGMAAPEILSFAQTSQTDLVVMGTHGRRAFERETLGSVAEDVIAASAVPVFVVPGRGDGTLKAGRLVHLLATVDGSPGSDRGLALACELARIEGAHLTLCTVAEPPRMRWGDRDRGVLLNNELLMQAQELLDAGRARASALGVEADTILGRGDAVAEILSAARSANADCIVVGTHGRAGIPRFFLGSVAAGVLRSSTIPVCTVRLPHER